MTEMPSDRERLYPAFEIDVQRHRDAAYKGGWDDGYAEGIGKAGGEAADQIEAQAKEIDELKAALNGAQVDLSLYEAEIEARGKRIAQLEAELAANDGLLGEIEEAAGSYVRATGGSSAYMSAAARLQRIRNRKTLESKAAG